MACIYSCNNTQFEKESECRFQLENSLAELSFALENKSKNVLVSGSASSGKTSLVLEYVRRNGDKYNNIVYAVFDKEKYLFYGKASAVSIDCILKTCLVRAAMEKCPENTANYLEEVEKLLDKDSLLIVDNYEILSQSPYMRRLSGLDARLVVVSRGGWKKLPDDFESVVPHMDNAGDCEGVDFSSYRILNRLCKNGLTKINDSDCSDTYDMFKRLFDACNLTSDEKELVMTLSAMLFYLEDTTEISSSEKGIFDRSSVKFYLGKLYGSLERLIELGIVNELSNGRICIDKAVMEFVIAHYKPDSSSCRCFMEFVQGQTDYLVVQSVKDELARFYTVGNGECDFAVKGEFYDVYTHFCLSDENRAVRLYNILVSCVLLHICPDNNMSDSLDHLFMKNKSFFIKCVLHELTEQDCSEIYNERLYPDGYLPESYTCDVRKHLDIVRISVAFLKNVTTDMYDLNRDVFDALYSCMSFVLEKAESSEISLGDRLSMLDDCIRICYESFAYHETVAKSGEYNYFRESGKARLTYCGDVFSDINNACSLDMGYGIKMLELYGLFQRLLYDWLELSDVTENTFENSFLEKLHIEKYRRRKECMESISVHYCRIKLGLGEFCDFYEDENRNVKLWKETPDAFLEEQLERNKLLLKRGFDSGTKIGAERYAERVIAAVKGSENAECLVRTVTACDYPVSDRLYGCLLEKDFSRLVSENENIPNRSKQKLSLYLVDTYNELMHANKKSLYRSLISDLCENVTFSYASLNRFFHVVSSMYFENKTLAYSERHDIDMSFADSLYVRFCENVDFNEVYADDLIARALYEYEKNGKTAVNIKTLKNAFTCACFEYMTEDCGFDKDGFFNICRAFCGKEFESELKKKTDVIKA